MACSSISPVQWVQIPNPSNSSQRNHLEINILITDFSCGVHPKIFTYRYQLTTTPLQNISLLSIYPQNIFIVWVRHTLIKCSAHFHQWNKYTFMHVHKILNLACRWAKNKFLTSSWWWDAFLHASVGNNMFARCVPVRICSQYAFPCTHLLAICIPACICWLVRYLPMHLCLWDAFPHTSVCKMPSHTLYRSSVGCMHSWACICWQ